jgi:hypothetical protein
MIRIALLSALSLVAGTGCGVPGASQTNDDLSAVAQRESGGGYSLAALRLLQGPVLYYDNRNLSTWAGRGGYGVRFDIDVAVRNDSYQKQVKIAWHAIGEDGSPNKASSPWADCVLSYNGVLDGNMERWSGNCTANTGFIVDTVELAANAVMNGQSYWDNNSGKNHLIDNLNTGVRTPSPAQGLWLFSTVERPGTTVNPGTDWLSTGQVRLYDYATSKSASLVYTLDGWASTQVAALTGPDADGLWRWAVPMKGVASGGAIEFAVVYRAGSEEFWANNGGRNYRDAVP